VPEAGDYLLTHVGFSKTEKPTLFLQHGLEIISFEPLGKTLTLRFDTSTRFCTGWYDMRNGEDHVCPESATIDGKYEQCPACQKRTGFNPAFYHATSVSEQQEERNQEPHFLYLAHFGPGIVKVGISHAARGNARLLEQGARSALILDTFPTAHVARQYEAKMAALPGIVETLQLRKKVATLSKAYDVKAAEHELSEFRQKIESALAVTFAKNHIVVFDRIFFPSGIPTLTEAYDCSIQNLISGHVTGMLGTLLFCKQEDVPLFLPLKRYLGYHVTLTYDETPIALPARQTSLF
jgi:hypothetical protein